jgi:hypothetical protein
VFACYTSNVRLGGALLVFALSTGCTFRVPGAVENGDGSTDASVVAPDLEGDLSDFAPPDQAREDLSVVDMTRSNDLTGSVCNLASMRACTDATHSAHCDVMTGTWAVDRTCPPGSICADGVCAPSTPLKACSKDPDCLPSRVCSLFVVAGALKGYCADPVPGGGGAFTNCGPPFGSDSTCASGLCARDAQDHHQCLVPCTGPADCPGASHCNPVVAPLVIEGVSTSMVKFCSK